MAPPAARRPLAAGTMARRPVRILCLHGYQTGGDILRCQLQRAGWTRALEPRGVEFVCLDAPHATGGRVDPVVAKFFPGMPNFNWWDARKNSDGSWDYRGQAASVAAVEAAILRETDGGRGGIDGLLGFSQGACFAHTLMCLQAQGAGLRELPPLKFSILIAGFKSRNAAHRGMLDRTDFPCAHVYGQKDPGFAYSAKLAREWPRAGGLVQEHGKGHVVPDFNRDLDGPGLMAFLEQHSRAKSYL